MYIRAVHAETDVIRLHKFIHDNPLGIFTTAIKSTQESFIQSSHIPFVLDPAPTSSNAAKCVLRGHMAKQNPQAKALMEALAAHQEQTGNNDLELPEEVLVLFNGPYHHYVTPKFYAITKPATGKVAPTWNYSAVQAYGKIRVYCDSKAEETGIFLQRLLEDLTLHAETSIMGFTGGDKESAWRVNDAPKAHVEVLKKNIIGFEIRVERLEGRFKMSQDKGIGDRNGVIRGFEGLQTYVGDGIAAEVRERGDMKDRGYR